MAGMQPTTLLGDHGAKTSTKRRAPMFLPKKQKRVRQAHSPKTVALPSSTPTTRLSPTLKGVQEAARLMSTGRVVAIPTETVYTLCTCMSLNDNKKDAIVQTAASSSPPALLVRSTQRLAELFPKSAYAIQYSDGSSSRVVKFNESLVILQRLAKQCWPGPLRIYMSTANELPDFLRVQAPFENETACKEYVALACPSHPLFARVLKEVQSTDNNGRIVIGYPTRHTTAVEVSCHHDDDGVAVLDGEDQHECFAVPTCQYGRECHVSLWIDASTRRVHIVGSEEDMVDVSPSIVQVLLLQTPANKSADPIRSRVIASVLSKWKIVHHDETAES